MKLDIANDGLSITSETPEDAALLKTWLDREPIVFGTPDGQSLTIEFHAIPPSAVSERSAILSGFRWEPPKGLDLTDIKTAWSEEGPSFGEGVVLFRLNASMRHGAIQKVVKIPGLAFGDIKGMYATLKKLLDNHNTFQVVSANMDAKVVEWPKDE